MDDGDNSPKGSITEWISTTISPVDSPPQPRRRKNRQRRNKGRKQKEAKEELDVDMQTSSVEERKSVKDAEVEWLDSEVEEGNVEYKLKIKDPNCVRFQQLVTQMKFRLSEGNGICYYGVGVADDGYPRGLMPAELQQSVDGVFRMAELLHAKAEIRWKFTGGYGRECAVIKVVRLLHERLFEAGIRIGVIGAVDVGKSTLIACLTNGDDGEPLLDDGQGSARTNILRHKHEIETGHTSTVTKHFLGYANDGHVLNYSGLSTKTSAEIGLEATQRVNLVDMGGHEKLLKTVFRGLTSMVLDYVLLCVSAATGLTDVSAQQISVALALNLPIIYILTKADIATQEQTNQTIQDIKRLYSSMYPQQEQRLLEDTPKVDWQIMEFQRCEETATIARALARMDSKRVCIPILRVSVLSGQGLVVLHSLLRDLESRIARLSSSSDRFQIDEVIELTHAGSILSGTLISGTLRIGETRQLGPDCHGEFQLVRVKSIRCNQVPVREVLAGQTATIGVSLMKATSPRSEPTDVEIDDNEDESDDDVIHRIRKELRDARANCGVVTRLENARDLEGTVLLGVDVECETYRCFEALLVLKGGQWPPRGLISGKWPPKQSPDSESDSHSGGSFAEIPSARLRSCSPLRPKKHQPGSFSIEIYCEGVRQAATILSIEEIADSDPLRSTLPESVQKAAALSSSLSVADSASPCMAKVRFQLQIKHEYLRLGSIIVVRDQTLGHLSGIGVISDLQ